MSKNNTEDNDNFKKKRNWAFVGKKKITLRARAFSSAPGYCNAFPNSSSITTLWLRAGMVVCLAHGGPIN